MTPGWWIRRTWRKPVAVGRRARRFRLCVSPLRTAQLRLANVWGACGPQVSTLAMYALLPVVVLMEQKFPPEEIEESHSTFTCDALLKGRCLCPAAKQHAASTKTKEQALDPMARKMAFNAAQQKKVSLSVKWTADS